MKKLLIAIATLAPAALCASIPPQTVEQRCAAEVRTFNTLVQTNAQVSIVVFSFIDEMRKSIKEPLGAIPRTDEEMLQRTYDMLYAICVRGE